MQRNFFRISFRGSAMISVIRLRKFVERVMSPAVFRGKFFDHLFYHTNINGLEFKR